MKSKTEKKLFHKDRIIENWDELYKLKSTPWDSGREEKILTDLIETGKIKKGLTLDIGCGQGTDSLYLKEKGFPVIGIDISLYGLRLAREKGKNKNIKIILCQGDALELPFISKSFDLINDRGCFHHINKKNRPDYCSEIYRILKPEGKILLRVFGENYFKSGGSGQPLYKKEIKKIFEKFFYISEILDYKGMGNKWSVDMTWTLMYKKIKI